jgi:hypothetical protein
LLGPTTGRLRERRNLLQSPTHGRNYFIDDVYLNEAGHDRLARYYAYCILMRDFPSRDWTSLGLKDRSVTR